MSAVPPFHLVTLGHLALHDAEGHDVLPPDVAKPLALLAFLVAAPGRRCSRERLVDLFWGDSALEQGRSSLRQVLYRLREALGDAAIRSEGTELQLCAGLTTDRDSFLSALDRGDLDTALAHYRGAYVADFVSRGTSQFEHWRDQEQDRLHDLFTNAIDAAGQRALEAGRASEAAALAQRVLQDHPLDERGWRLRLQAEQLSGSRIHLAASIAELRRIFATEGWEPQPRTLQLLEALERNRGAHADRSAGEALDGDLIGRGTVMASLYHHWRHSNKRIGAHLHLVGGAGLGKSRVMDDFAVRIRSERGRVVRAGAYPRQRFVPDSMLASVIAALADLPGAKGIAAESARILIDLQPTVSSRFPAAAPHANGDDHARAAAVGEAMRDLFEAVTDDGALCLLLDDAHWWDDDSRHQLEATIERLHNRPILVVTASRPGSSEIVTALTQERIELARWQEDDVLALLQSLGSTDDDSAMTRLAHALCDAAEGVPLLVIEALRLGLGRGLIALNDRHWSFAGLGEFEGILHPGQLLRERASTLTLHQRHLLLVTWLLESEITHDDWHTVDAESHGGTLVELERLGFLTSSGRGWKIGHDAIGEAIEQAAAEDALRAAHRDAGFLSLQRGDHAIVLRQAAKHGLESGEQSLMQQVALKWVRQRRLGGSLASTQLLLGEVFPAEVSPTVFKQLARDLPIELPRRPWSARRLAPIWAIAGAAVALAAFTIFERTLPPGTILGVYGTDRTGRVLDNHFTLRHDAWGSNAEVTRSVRGNDEVPPWGRTPAESLSNGPITHPSGTRWIFARTRTDSNGPTELVVQSDGAERVIADAPGDDAQPAWSPDGAFVVFQSTRWTSGDRRNFDLAIVDVATDRVHRLTSGGDDETTPIWSPDGSRIAYIKHSARAGADSVCWIAVNGFRGVCRTENDHALSSVLGWRDASTVIITSQVGEECQLPTVNVDNGAIQQLLPKGVCALSLSPDGSWLAWPLNATATSTTSRVAITSLSGVPATREVVLPSATGSALWLYWRGPWHTRWLKHVAIQHRGDTLYSGSPYQLELRGVDEAGAELAIPTSVISWRSSDTSVAAVDSAGRVNPRRTGSAFIYGSAGGWRVDSVRLVIADRAATIVHTENWSADWTTRWNTSGEPRPIISNSGPGGSPAFLVNGDGVYNSSAYSVLRFDPRLGVALDARLTTPITQPKWQSIRIGLAAITGATRGGLVGNGGCTFAYPKGEGWDARNRAATQDGGVEVGTSLLAGNWYAVRVQIFPDGTCGFAIDGKPVYRSVTPAVPSDSVAIMIEGQTVGAALLVGPLKVWNGVPGDIDWAKLAPLPRPN